MKKLNRDPTTSDSWQCKKLIRRLRYYALIETGIAGDANPFITEELFRLIVKEAGSKPEPTELALISQYPANMFNQEHLNHFYRMLVVIVEGLPITTTEKIYHIRDD